MSSRFNRNELFGILALSVFGAVTFVVFLMPHLQALEALRRQYFSQVQQAGRRDAQRRLVKETGSRLDETDLRLARVERRFLKQDQATAFLETISRLVRQTGNNLESIKPLGESAGPSAGENRALISEQSVRLELTGAFANLKALLEALRDHEKFIKVEGLRIRRSGAEGPLNYDFTLKFYLERNEP
jgi:hypothetical protein